MTKDEARIAFEAGVNFLRRTGQVQFIPHFDLNFYCWWTSYNESLQSPINETQIIKTGDGIPYETKETL